MADIDKLSSAADTERARRFGNYVDGVISTAQYHSAAAKLRKPQEAANLLKVSRDTGIDPEIIHSLPSGYEMPTEEIEPSFTLSKYLAEDVNLAAVSKDDHANLNRVDEEVQKSKKPKATLADAFMHGREANARLGKLAALDLHGLALDSDYAEMEEIIAKYEGFDYTSTPVLRQIQQGAEIIGQVSQTVTDPVNLAYTASTAVSGSIIPGIGTAAGAKVGVAGSFLKDAYMVESGHAWLELKNLADENGQPINPNVARGGAIAAGLINAGIEFFQLKYLAKLVGPVLTRKVVTGAIGKAIANRQVGKAVLNVMGQYGKNVAIETAQEVGQELTNILSASVSGEINDLLEGTDFQISANPLESSNFTRLSEIVEKTAGGTSALGFLPAMSRVTQAGIQANNAQNFYARQLALKSKVDETFTEQRSPEAMDTFLQMANTRSYEVDPKAANELIESTPEIFETLDISQDEISKAEAAGHTIKIDSTQALTKLDSNQFNQLVEIAMEDTGSITLKEALDMSEKEHAEEELREEINERVEQETEFSAELDRIRSEVALAGLAEPDVTTDQVEKQADHITSILRSKAQFLSNYGIDLTEALRRVRIEVVEPGKELTSENTFFQSFNPDPAAELSTVAQRLQFLAEEGADSRFWYEESGAAILNAVRGNKAEADKLAQIIAAFSPQSQVFPNVWQAIKAYNQFYRGEEITAGKFKTMNRKAQSIMEGNREFLTHDEFQALPIEERSSLKTNNFYLALTRQFDPNYRGGVAIDLWMMRALGYDTDNPTVGQYAEAEQKVTELADRMGWEPQQAQAAVWSAMKSRWEQVSRTLRKNFKDDGLITKNGKFRSPEAEKQYRRAVMEAAMELDTEAPENYNFSHALAQSSAQVSLEAIPGRDVEDMLPEMHMASYEKKLEYTQAVFEKLIDPVTGGDVIAEMLGIPSLGRFFLPGAWEQQTSPSVQMQVPVGKDTNGLPTVDSASRDAMEAYCCIMGLLLNQDAVAWHYPLPTRRVEDTNGVSVDIGRPITAEEMAAIEEAARTVYGVGTAFVATPSGINVFGFDDTIDKTAAYSQLKELMAAAFGDFDEVQMGRFYFDGNLIENRTEQGSYGTNYRQRITELGASDILVYAEDVIYPQIADVNRYFSRKYNWGNPGPDSIRPAESIEEGILSGKPIRLKHFSARQDLTETDPTQFGTAGAGAERSRQQLDPEGFAPRTYFGGPKYQREEAQGVGEFEHETIIDPKRVYNLTEDPEGFKKQALETLKAQYGEPTEMARELGTDVANAKYINLVERLAGESYDFIYSPRADVRKFGQQDVAMTLRPQKVSRVRDDMPRTAVALAEIEKAPPLQSEEFKSFMEGSTVQEPVYHYSRAAEAFEAFDPDISQGHFGVHIGTLKQATEFPGTRKFKMYANIKNPFRMKDTGFWYATDIVIALYTPGMDAAEQYIAAAKGDENALRLRDKLVEMAGKSTQEQNAIARDALMAEGYDSIVYVNRYEGLDVKPQQKEIITDPLTGQPKGTELGIDNKQMSDAQFKMKYKAEDSYLVWDSSQLKSESNIGPFNRETENIYQQARKGSISITDEEVVIRVIKGAADLSTIAHELGHLFLSDLEMLVKMGVEDADLRTDLAAVYRFLGAGFEQGIEVAQHEKFADAFLTYLMEGKSPSPAMDGVFESYRKWLTQLYHAKKGEIVEINPEIRGLFDRMLTTDQEVEVAAVEAGIADFTEKEMDAMQMTPDEKKYLKSLTRAVTRKAQGDLQKERAKERGTRYKRFKEEAEKELNDTPLFKLRNTLFNDGGLDYDQVLAMAGPKAIEEIRKKNIRFIRKDGRDIRAVAEEVGYGYASSLIEALRTSPSKEDAVSLLANQKQEAYEAQSTAEEAVSKQERLSQMLEATSTYLARAAQVTEPRQSLAKIKNFAEKELENIEMKQAARPDRYLGYLKRAMMEERAAVAKGDYRAALDANSRARLNLEFARRSTAIRDMLRKTRRKAAKVVRTKDGSMNMQHHVNLLSLILRFELSPLTKAAKNRLEADFSKKQPLSRLVDKSQDALLDGGSDWSGWLLEEGFSKRYSDLTVAEFSELSDLVNHLNGIGREELALQIGDEKIKARELAIEIAQNAASLPSRWVPKETNPLRGVVNFSREYVANADNLLTIMRWMDGHANVDKAGTKGPAERYLWDQLAEAYNYKLELSEKVTELLDTPWKRLLKTASNNPEIIETGVAVPESLAKDGRGWTTERIIAVALNMGNAENRTALKEGYGLSDEDLESITKSLSNEDWDAIQAIWDIFDKYLWPKNDATFFRLNYFHRQKVKADQFTAPTGKTLRGGYYPIEFDGTLDDEMKAWTEQSDYMHSYDAMWGHPAAKGGHMKARIGSGGRPINLSMGVLGKQLEQSIQYISHAEVVRFVDRVTNSSTFKAMAKDKMGNAEYSMILPALKNIARGEYQRLSSVDKLLKKYHGLSTVYILGAKVSVALKQPYSLFGYIQKHGLKPLVSGATKLLTSPIETRRAIQELSPYMRNRANLFERDIVRAKMDFELPGKTKQLTNDVKSKIRDAMFALIRTMDALAVLPAWQGKYEEALKTTSDVNEAVRIADGAIEDTQPSARPMDKSYFQYAKGWHRLFTMFSTFTMLYGNRQRQNFRAWKAGELSNTRYMEHVIVEGLLPPLLMQVMFGAMWGREPDDDELRDTVTNVLSYQVVGLPYFRSVAYTASKVAAGDRFSTSLPPQLQASRLIGETLGNIPRWVADLDDDQRRDKAVRNISDLLSYSSGVPASRVYRDLKESLKQIEEDEITIFGLGTPDPDKRRNR